MAAPPPAAAAGAEREPSGAERLLRAAVEAGVEVCFANPGGWRVGTVKGTHARPPLLCAGLAALGP